MLVLSLNELKAVPKIRGIKSYKSISKKYSVLFMHQNQQEIKIMMFIIQK